MRLVSRLACKWEHLITPTYLYFPLPKVFPVFWLSRDFFFVRTVAHAVLRNESHNLYNNGENYCDSWRHHHHHHQRPQHRRGCVTIAVIWHLIERVFVFALIILVAREKPLSTHTANFPIISWRVSHVISMAFSVGTTKTNSNMKLLQHGVHCVSPGGYYCLWTIPFDSLWNVHDTYILWFVIGKFQRELA